MSLGIVQQAPTQFDDPLYCHMAKESSLEFVVYYYGARESDVRIDPEIGRQVGWNSASQRAYSASYCSGMSPFRFAKQVVRAKHDLIIISGYRNSHALATALLARIARVPTGLRSDNVVPSKRSEARYWTLKRMLYPALFKLYTTGHPVGHQAAKYLQEFGFKKESLFRFPYAVDHLWFAQECAGNHANLAEVRARWGLSPTARVVCGVMKFSEREDPLTLLNAFKQAKKEIPALALLLVGDGPLRTRIIEAAGDEFGKSIFLPGYQKYSALPAVYAASDLFVHTAVGPWEVSVNEALACGLPVITSDAVGSAQELVIPKGFGCTFKYGDFTELAAHIVRVMCDDQLLMRTREQALQSLSDWDYPATEERFACSIEYAKSAAK